MHWDTAKQDNYSTVGGDGGCTVGEVRASTSSPWTMALRIAYVEAKVAMSYSFHYLDWQESNRIMFNICSQYRHSKSWKTSGDCSCNLKITKSQGLRAFSLVAIWRKFICLLVSMNCQDVYSQQDLNLRPSTLAKIKRHWANYPLGSKHSSHALF